MAIDLLRDSVINFMTANPSPWRVKALAANLHIGVNRLRQELSQLLSEGKLISCTVKVPGQQLQEEYRISAILRKLDPHLYVITKKTNVRFR